MTVSSVGFDLGSVVTNSEISGDVGAQSSEIGFLPLGTGWIGGGEGSGAFYSPDSGKRVL